MTLYDYTSLYDTNTQCSIIRSHIAISIAYCCTNMAILAVAIQNMGRQKIKDGENMSSKGNKDT